MKIPLTQEESAIVTKTRELCQTLLAEPSFISIRRRVDAFMADDAARAQYENVHMMGQTLREKQQSGVELSDTEIADFEKNRDQFLSNPVSRGFLDAQDEMQEIRESVVKHVMKTFELGRLPTAEDLQSCGQGCNCNH